MTYIESSLQNQRGPPWLHPPSYREDCKKDTPLRWWREGRDEKSYVVERVDDARHQRKESVMALHAGFQPRGGSGGVL